MRFNLRSSRCEERSVSIFIRGGLQIRQMKRKHLHDMRIDHNMDLNSILSMVETILKLKCIDERINRKVFI